MEGEEQGEAQGVYEEVYEEATWLKLSNYSLISWTVCVDVISSYLGLMVMIGPR